MAEYIQIILDEYGQFMSLAQKEILYDHFDHMVQWNQEETISFVVRNHILYLPISAYKMFEKFENSSNYGIRFKKYHYDKYLNTDTTYFDYINEVIECGLRPVDYFLESLLHEAMHLCGSDGGDPLEEGINELKTRYLAEKKSLTIAAMGYSKEVSIALQFQNLVGEDIVSQLTFLSSGKKLQFLRDTLGEDYAELYKNLDLSMISKFKPSMIQVSDPYEKARIYSSINYEEEKKTIDAFLESHKKGNK